MLLNYLFGGIVAFGVLVAVHEFGHFIVARWCGVRVLVFSIGFGKAIWRRTTSSGMCLQIASIPLGGYVKLLNRYTINELPESQQSTCAAKTIEAQPWWQQIAIVLAGPAINLLFAIVLFAITHIIGTYQLRPIVGEVLSRSAAERAGFLPGETITQLGDETIASWTQFDAQLLAHFGEDALRVSVISENTIKERVIFINLTPSDLDGSTSPTEIIGLSPKIPPLSRTIATVVSNSPASKAGIIAGDTITAVKGIATNSWRSVSQQLARYPHQTVTLQLLRNGTTKHIELLLDGVLRDGRTIGYLGVVPSRVPYQKNEYFVYQKASLITAVQRSVTDTWRLSSLILHSIGYMLTGQLSLDSLGGPVAIVNFAGESLAGGVRQFIHFMALLSVSLGIFNLLPLPLLDGGHVVIYTIEAIRGKTLSEKLQQWLFRLGGACLLAIAMVAFINDLARLLT